MKAFVFFVKTVADGESWPMAYFENAGFSAADAIDIATRFPCRVSDLVEVEFADDTGVFLRAGLVGHAAVAATPTPKPAPPPPPPDSITWAAIEDLRAQLGALENRVMRLEMGATAAAAAVSAP